LNIPQPRGKYYQHYHHQNTNNNTPADYAQSLQVTMDEHLNDEQTANRLRMVRMCYQGIKNIEQSDSYEELLARIIWGVIILRTIGCDSEQQEVSNEAFKCATFIGLIQVVAFQGFEALAHNNELHQRIAQVTRDIRGERYKNQAEYVTVNGNFENMLRFLGTHDTSLKSEGYFTLISDHRKWEWYASIGYNDDIYRVRIQSERARRSMLADHYAQIEEPDNSKWQHNYLIFNLVTLFNALYAVIKIHQNQHLLTVDSLISLITTKTNVNE
jgi:hypothetical protein